MVPRIEERKHHFYVQVEDEARFREILENMDF